MQRNFIVYIFVRELKIFVLRFSLRTQNNSQEFFLQRYHDQQKLRGVRKTVQPDLFPLQHPVLLRKRPPEIGLEKRAQSLMFSFQDRNEPATGPAFSSHQKNTTQRGDSAQTSPALVPQGVQFYAVSGLSQAVGPRERAVCVWQVRVASLQR